MMKKMTTKIGKRVERVWDHKKTVWSIFFGDEAQEFIFTHPEEAGITIEEFQDCDMYWKSVVVPYMVSKYSPEFVRKAVSSMIDERIVWFNKRYADLIEMNDDLRAQGLSFVERREKTGKGLEALKKLITEHEELKRGYAVVSLADILTPEFVKDIKRQGFKRFLQANFDYICQKKLQS